MRAHTATGAPKFQRDLFDIIESGEVPVVDVFDSATTLHPVAPIAPGKPAASGHTFRDAVAACFRARANVWIDGMTLAQHGGAYAWRSRVAECRTQLGMTIENRQRRVPGTGRTISEYRWLPSGATESGDQQ